MLKVTVNEKGGGERVLKFDKDVITIGRSQKNDVILPRSNVSKMHANAEVRDDMVIIADRGSTNGTFVNGRRVRTPTSIGPQDRVFISDFILNLEVAAQDAQDEALTLPPPLPGGDGAEGAIAEEPPSPTSPRTRRPVAPASAADDEVQVIEPEEEPEPIEEPEPVEEPEPIEEPKPVEEPEPQQQPTPAQAAQQSEQDDAEREVAARLFDEVDAVLGLERLDPQAFKDDEFRTKTKRTIAEVMDAMVDSGQLPGHLEPSRITERLGSEILGLGPMDAWLEDQDVAEIIVPARGDITLLIAGGYRSMSHTFACERSQQLAMRKILASLRDRTGESSGAVTGRLEGGERVSMLMAPLVLEGVSCVIRKLPVTVEGGVEGLVDMGALSPAMARFFGYCIEARQSVLICDPGLCSHRNLVPALAGMLDGWERLMAVQCGTEPLYDLSAQIYGILPTPSGDEFDIQGATADSVKAFASFRPTALIAGGLGNADHFRLVHEAKSSRAFVVGTMDTESEVQGLSRLGGWIASEHAKAPEFVTAEIIMDALDILVYYTRMIDGAERVSGISELVRSRDGSPVLKPIFLFHVSSVSETGAIQGTFRPTGHVPAFVKEQEGGKTRFDLSIFEKEK